MNPYTPSLHRASVPFSDRPDAEERACLRSIINRKFDAPRAIRDVLRKIADIWFYHRNHAGWIAPKIAQIAKQVRCSVSTVKRALALFRERGYLRAISNGLGGKSKATVYVLNTRTISESLMPPKVVEMAGELVLHERSPIDGRPVPVKASETPQNRHSAPPDPACIPESIPAHFEPGIKNNKGGQRPTMPSGVSRVLRSLTPGERSCLGIALRYPVGVLRLLNRRKEPIQDEILLARERERRAAENRRRQWRWKPLPRHRLGRVPAEVPF